MYSLPPLKLAWRGLGEVDNAFLGGILLPLHGYITVTGRFDSWVVLACLPFFFLCFNNLLAVTWPDRHADAQVGKMTLATIWPEGRLRKLYLIVATASFVSLLLLSGWIFPFEVTIVSLFSLPFVISGSATYTKNRVSSSTVYAMVVMMLFQMSMWIATGFNIAIW
jgi:1,4-dihydroxy-2-naphthoate octaprenyltransferase